MSSCFKCGRPVAGIGAECAACDRAGSEERIGEAFSAMDRAGVRLHSMDWSKVVTLEDYQVVCHALLSQWLVIPSDHPRFEQLKRFLEP